MAAYDRVFNFSAGPGTLPVPVLEQVRDELLNYGGSGMSVLEMSHRGGPYDAIQAATEADLRTLLGIPGDYKVLFLPGGATTQFTMLAKSFGPGAYVVSGAWGEKALEIAQIEGPATTAWSGAAEGYRRLPNADELSIDPAAKFFHYTSNETIQGVQSKAEPAVDLRLICDMSSDILSRPIDVSKYDMIYAGAQKNMGPAGVTVVIVKESLLETAPKGLPPMLDYRVQVKNDSRFNTPPTFPIYVCGLVYKHLLGLGGLNAVAERNEAKSQVLYSAVDASGGFYKGHAVPENRSTMNVVFTLPSEELTSAFLKEATALGFDGLKGHRSVGGLRASIYNAFPAEGCDALAAFMAEFAKKNG